MAMAVTERAGREHESGQRDGIGIDDPLQPGEVGLQRPLQRRQRDVDDADVQRGKEGTEVCGQHQRWLFEVLHGTEPVERPRLS